ncbi:alkylmercury lyase family protein [Rhodococcus opacus]|uniref:Alkylmercury lyase family protein n=1 Tax=Rhodococcus opacus (strain B4) TaxID=632772 RepID=C1AS11_RHOOB|nr:alkylmercury lyase family protein [Rhodococcus opacus]BAH48260.1 alkylmercury lyase family protein [Rhodococcus opacus B4]
MRLEILQVPGCPHVALLEQRLENVLAGQQSEVEISHRVIDDPAVAADAGMTGSPTLLVDGADPFAAPGLVPSVSCRLYPAEGGGVGGAPSVAALRQALHAAAADTADEPADGRGGCCSAGTAAESPLAGLGGWRDAARPRTPAERAIHYAILRAFADRGAPPEHAELDSVAAEFGEPGRRVLARLHTADVIRLDPAGRIASAYPFSTSPTPHRVRIGGGAGVYAMCAVDALGMSAMLAAEVVIESADPVTGEHITVTVHGESAVATPATVVVFVGADAGHGPSADTCCTTLNFFTDRGTARSGADEHPQVGGIVVDLADATRLGATIFGGALTT